MIFNLEQLLKKKKQKTGVFHDRRQTNKSEAEYLTILPEPSEKYQYED